MGVETRIEAGNWYLDARKNKLPPSTASIVTSVHNVKRESTQRVLQLSRILYKSPPFMQNKAKVKIGKMNISVATIKDYDKNNKQSAANVTQNKAKQSQS